MRKKVLWERISRLERDIAALLKLDDMVTQVNKSSNAQNSAGASPPKCVPEPPSVVAQNASINESVEPSKIIKTIHPPPLLRPKNKGSSTSDTNLKLENSSSETPQPETDAKIVKKEKIHSKSTKGNKSTSESNNLTFKRAPFTISRPRSSGDKQLIPQRENTEDVSPQETPKSISKLPERPVSCDSKSARISPRCPDLCIKYEAILQRLQAEARVRAEVERQLRAAQRRLELSSAALSDANHARAAALDVAQQLRAKYEVLRTARRLANDHLLALKTENARLAQQLEARQGSEEALRAQLEEERRGREARRADVADLLRRADAQREEADAQRRRADALQDQLLAERLKRPSAEEPEVQALLEGAAAPLLQRLEEGARALQEVEARERQLQRRLEEAEAKAVAAAHAAAAANAAAAGAQAALRARERGPARAEEPGVRELVAAETRALAEELQRHADAARAQQQRADDLERRLREQQEAEERRFREAEEGWGRARAAHADHERLVQCEREELQKLVTDLTETLQQHKARAADLLDAAHARDGQLRAANDALNAKGEELRAAQGEAEELRARAQALQAEALRAGEAARALRRANEELARRADAPRRCLRCETLMFRAAAAREELQEIKAKAEAARTNLRVKDKVVEDQAASLRRAKEQREEEREAAARDRQALQLDLAKERRAQQRIRAELSTVHRRCQQLEERAAQLEEELGVVRARGGGGGEAGGGDAARAERQQRLLEQLEAEVREQRRVWEEQTQRLAREKDLALQAAQFSARRLEETLTEFEQQVASHRKVQHMLATHLSQRERELFDAHKTIAELKQSAGADERPTPRPCRRVDTRKPSASGGASAGAWQEVVHRA